jgi:ribonuclease Z
MVIMLEIVFLGTGSGIPTPSRNHAGIWLRYEGESMLWDCGEGTQRQIFKARLNFMKIDRIFITHWHADHWAGLIGLLLTMNLEHRIAPLYIYGPEADRFVSDILDLGYWRTSFKVMAETVPHEGKEITSLVKTPDFEITSIPVEHSVPAVAYCFKEHDRRNVDIKKAEGEGRGRAQWEDRQAGGCQRPEEGGQSSILRRHEALPEHYQARPGRRPPDT